MGLPFYKQHQLCNRLADLKAGFLNFIVKAKL
jgi:hypothetical protein